MFDALIRTGPLEKLEALADTPITSSEVVVRLGITIARFKRAMKNLTWEHVTMQWEWNKRRYLFTQDWVRELYKKLFEVTKKEELTDSWGQWESTSINIVHTSKYNIPQNHIGFREFKDKYAKWINPIIWGELQRHPELNKYFKRWWRWNENYFVHVDTITTIIEYIKNLHPTCPL